MKRSLFFPRLARRTQYRLTNKGNYYADYGVYKDEIREDCQYRCYYCDSHEQEIGGQEHMQLDHFRPKLLPEFEHLKNDPNNLVYACSGCNRLKWDDWPASGLIGTINGSAGYIDRFNEGDGDCHQYFHIEDDGSFTAIKVPAKHLITQLALNRVTRRRIRELRLKRTLILRELNTMVDKLSSELEANGCELPDHWRDIVENQLHRMRQIRDTWVDISFYCSDR